MPIGFEVQGIMTRNTSNKDLASLLAEHIEA